MYTNEHHVHHTDLSRAATLRGRGQEGNLQGPSNASSEGGPAAAVASGKCWRLAEASLKDLLAETASDHFGLFPYTKRIFSSNQE